MPYESGGRADKYGNRYENNWVADLIISLVEEEIDSVKIEPLGDEEQGVDVIVKYPDGHKEYQQCKARNRSLEYWRFSDLTEKNIFKHWKNHLDREISNTVSLVTPLPFTNLEDLIQRAKTNSGNPTEFYKNQILTANQEFIQFYEQFCKKMGLGEGNDDIIKSLSYLRRISIRQWPDGETDNILLKKISYLFIGEPNKILNKMKSLIYDGDILGREIDVQEINRYLKNNDIRYKNLANNNQIYPNINKLNSDYKMDAHFINNKLIDREEFREIRNKITKEQSLVIHGKAGIGKSSCTYDLINHCEENKITYLALKLDKRQPVTNASIWGEKLGFPASIAHSLHSITKDKQAVLILDQLDSLRWTSAHSRSALTICEEVINEVKELNLERKHKISIVLVCRSFDLENDNNINMLFKEKRNNLVDFKWNKVNINELSIENAKKIIGPAYNDLGKKLKILLLIPSNLYIWEQLPSDIQLDNISTTYHLVQKWWDSIIQERPDSDSLHELRKFIVGWLENNNKYYIPTHIINNTTGLNFLLSSGILIKQGEKVSFAHQSILDSFVAINMFEKYYNGEDITKIIGTKAEQTPTKRYQLQIFMENLLHYDSSDFIELGKLIFTSDKIRFFMKFIFIELLNQVEHIDESIEEFILENCENELYEKYIIDSIVYSNSNYVRMLIENELLDKWFKDDEKKDLVFTLLKSIASNFTTTEVDFINKHKFNNKKDDLNFIKSLPFSIAQDTVEVFNLRMTFYEIYPDQINKYINLNEILNKNELHAVEILAFVIKEKSKTSDGFVNNYEETFLYKDTTISYSNSLKILDILIKVLPKNFNLNWEKNSLTDKSAERLAIKIIKKVNVNILLKNPNDFLSYYNRFLNRGYPIYNEIIMEGLLHLPLEYSNQIIEYVIEIIRKNTFDITSGQNDSLGSIKQLIIKFSEYADRCIYRKLEYTIINYFPSDAKDRYERRIRFNKENKRNKVYWSFYGELQYELLNVLPDALLSNKAKSLRKVMNRKFPTGTHEFKNNLSQSGGIRSSITGKKISNEGWLQLLKNQSLYESSKTPITFIKGNFIENNIRSFSTDFYSAVAKEPSRMIEIVLNNFDEILEEFINTLLRGVANSDKLNKIPKQLLEDLILKIPFNIDEELEFYICDIITKKEKTKWSAAVIRRVMRIANIAISKQDSEKSIIDPDELLNYSYNSLIGTNARAIKTLIHFDSELLNDFKSIIEIMCESKKMSVQYSALFPLYAAYSINESWTAKLILSLLEKSISNIVFPNTKDVIFIIYDKFPEFRERLLKLVLKAFNSDHELINSRGSNIVAEMYLYHNEFTNLFDNVHSWTGNQVKVILEMSVLYFDLKDGLYNDKVKEIFYKVLKSHSNTVLPVRALFEDNHINLKRDRDFIIEVLGHGDTEQIVYTFVNYLKKYAKSIIDYKEIVIELAVEVIKKYEINGDPLWIEDEISKLILNLYDEVSSSEKKENKIIAQKCLDLWDLMYEKQIGSVRALSNQLINL